MYPIPFMTRGRIALIGAAALIAAALVLVAALRDAGATGRADGTPAFEACSAPTRAFNAGPAIEGLRLDHVRRVCSEPEPVISETAGGGVDPDSLHRSNFTSFVYGTCTPRGDSGCPYPLEIQVWPACERNPSTYGSAGPTADLGPGEHAGAEVIAQTTVRQAPVTLYGDSGPSASAADDVPERAETIVGDSTVVVFTDGAAGGAAERARMLRAIAMLRPAGDSNAPTAGAAPSAAVMSAALPAPAAGALRGALECSS
jgi:hypothetical protein